MPAVPLRSPARSPLGAKWQLCEAPPGSPQPAPGAGWTDISRPMSVAAALREAGRWSLEGERIAFDARDWWYRATFDAPPSWREGTSLGFDGLATVCQAWLNEQPLLATDNMFVAHEADVTSLLRATGNELVLRFASLDSLLQAKRARPRWRAPMVANQQLRWWRTTLLGRTPGWSPPCPVVGPWKDIWLERRNVGTGPAHASLQAHIEGDSGVVQCEFFPGDEQAVSAVTVRLSRDAAEWAAPLAWNPQRGCHEGTLRIEAVQRWWPHTHGTPALYDAAFVVRAYGSDTEQAAGRVGFRSIDVDTRDGGFRVHVNGVPVFCRGAVWTPLDAVTLRSGAAAYRAAVEQARDAGMNMLRVPGTGVYEDDAFYAACDEAGVLVWQEFMFANMDYPAGDPAFARSVEREVRQQLLRLREHACLAVLCGNSEVGQQAAMWGTARELWKPPLFHETLPALCRELAPGIVYWPSSAHGGAFPHQADTGTTSYYGVGAYLRPIHDARDSQLRFATECLAFANVPGEETLAKLPGGSAVRAHHAAWKERSPRDLGAGWDFDDVRDHYLAQLCKVDPVRLRATDHDRYLRLSRMASAHAMADAFGQWRRTGSPCSGALVLMLRDLWPGAGWGVIDSDGVPKACWYALKRALQPVAVWITDEGMNGLAIHVANDSPEPKRMTLELGAWRNGDVRVAAGSKTLTVGAHRSECVPATDLLEGFIDLGYAWRFGPPPCDVVAVSLREMAGAVLGTAFHFPEGLALARDVDPQLDAVIESASESTATLRISTRRLATGVHFEVPGYTADDDFFHLAPGSHTQVRFRRRPGASTLSGFVHALNSAHALRIEQAK